MLTRDSRGMIQDMLASKKDCVPVLGGSAGIKPVRPPPKEKHGISCRRRTGPTRIGGLDEKFRDSDVSNSRGFHAETFAIYLVQVIKREKASLQRLQGDAEAASSSYREKTEGTSTVRVRVNKQHSTMRI